MFWRIVAVCSITAFYAVAILQGEEILQLPTSEGFDVFTDESVRKVSFYLMLLCAISHPSANGRPCTTATLSNRLLQVAGAAAAGILIVVVCLNRTMVGYLVYLAIVGMEHNEPLSLSVGDPVLTRRNLVFFATSTTAFLFVPINFLLLRAVSTHGLRWTHRRIAAVLLFGVGLVVTLGYSLWVWTIGLHGFSPSMAEAIGLASWHYLLTSLLLVLFVSATLAVRLTSRPDAVDTRTDIGAFASARGDYHRKRWFSIAIVLVLAFLAICSLLSQYRLVNAFQAFSGGVSGLALLVQGVASDPAVAIATAVFLIALGNSLARKRTALVSAPILPIPPGRFVTCWILSFLIIAFGALPTVWFVFALWLTPWYRMPLLGMQ